MNQRSRVIAFFMLVLSATACTAPKNEFDEVLNKFDEMVGVYESYTRKDPFCVEYVIQINGEVLTKLNDLADKAKKMKEAGPEPSKQQMDRYIRISTRMSQAMLALGNSMKNAKMCGSASGMAPQVGSVPPVPAATPEAPSPALQEAPAAATAQPAQEPTPQESVPQQSERTPTASPPPAADAVKPSFDCAKAAAPTEKMICGSPELARLDVQLADSYRSARGSGVDQERLKVEQVAWIQQSRKCRDEACLAQSYRSRIAELAKVAR